MTMDDLVLAVCTTPEPSEVDVLATQIAQAACFEVLMQEDVNEVDLSCLMLYVKYTCA